VVGIGNSGGEIAIDLWEAGAETSIAVRSPMHVTPRDLGGSPAQLTGMLMSRLPPRVADRITLAILDRVYGDLSGYGLRRPALGPMTQVMEKGKIPLIDVGTIELIKQGHLRVLHGIDHFDGSNVIMTDGASHSFDLVVLATGYRAALSGFLENAEPHLNERGYPTISGHEAAAPGLYFIGFRNPPTGQLYDISREAPRIANHIRSKHG
jgi:indole-3-pyruvate monooxygenase